MIHMEDRHWRMVQDILKKYPYEFYAYGSRVKGTNTRLSDLDICFIESIPYNVQAHIEEDFENSDLPFLVDLIDFRLMRPEFQKLIKSDMIIIQKKSDKL